MSDLGRRRRNQSLIRGSLAHTFEFFYTGPHADDLVVTIDVFIDIDSDHYDRSGPSPNNFETVSDSIGQSASPDQCFELYGVLGSIFTMKDLQGSIFCRPEDWPDLYDLIRSSELVTNLLDHTALTDITGLYSDYRPHGLDNIDHSYSIILLR